MIGVIVESGMGMGFKVYSFVTRSAKWKSQPKLKGRWPARQIPLVADANPRLSVAFQGARCELLLMHSRVPPKKGAESKPRACLAFVRPALGFAILWIAFYGLFRGFPYLTSGAEVIYQSKLRQEIHGSIFPPGHDSRRVLIFGDSRILAGFMPDLFDRLAEADNLHVRSYNSGYPGKTTFVPQLKQIVRNKSNIPDVLLLTEPWGSTPAGLNIFHPFPNDFEIASRLFPFRNLLRDTLSFLVTSREHGGPLNYYRESRENDAKMLQDRGYYFISEQSHYPGNRLPDDFHLGSDKPGVIQLRVADPDSRELSELNWILKSNHIACYYVPVYLRRGEAAPAPDVDQSFADLLRRYTPCKMLGPDYYLYPNRMFSDLAHLNPEGARTYTETIYHLVEKQALEP